MTIRQQVPEARLWAAANLRKVVRGVLKHFGLPVTGDLLNRTYEHVRETY